MLNCSYTLPSFPSGKGLPFPLPPSRTQAGESQDPSLALGAIFCHLGNLLFFITFSMPFGINFCSIFDPNLPIQIHQNRSKIDPKRHRKSDEKKKFTKMAKKSLQDPADDSGTTWPGSRKGVGGRVNPSPKEGRKGIGTAQHLKPPSHQGWWDFIYIKSHQVL